MDHPFHRCLGTAGVPDVGTMSSLRPHPGNTGHLICCNLINCEEDNLRKNPSCGSRSSCFRHSMRVYAYVDSSTGVAFLPRSTGNSDFETLSATFSYQDLTAQAFGHSFPLCLTFVPCRTVPHCVYCFCSCQQPEYHRQLRVLLKAVGWHRAHKVQQQKQHADEWHSAYRDFRCRSTLRSR